MTEQRDPDRASVTRRAVRGMAWTLPTSLGARVVGLVGTLLLARYLAPSDYGEVSAAVIVVLTASSMTTFGVGIYLVTNRDVTRADAFHATFWFLAVGLAAFALAFGLSGPLGAWFGAPSLRHFVPLLLVSGLLDRVGYVPERMAVRQLRFGWVSTARALGELAYTCVSLLLAALGFGAMAIAWGNVARSAVRFALITPSVGWREWLEPHRLRLATLARIIVYGVNVSATSIAAFAMRRWDNLLVSRYFGPAAMGAYNYAYNLADTPAVAIGEQMTDVITASFPHVNREKRADALVQACTMISVIMFPLAFGLGAVSQTVVETFFDRRWAGVGTMLMLLSVLSATRPMAHVLVGYFYAGQRPGVVLWLEWLSLGAIVLAIPTIGRISTTWTCISVGSVFVLRTLAATWIAQRLDGARVSSLLRPLVGPLLACLAMVGAILAARPELQGLAPARRLAAEVSLGGLVYLAGAFVLFRSTSRELLGLVRSALWRGGR
ncbi:MAG TPA: oligosaccharide flippase family protein [Anaeromyxobacter sp.]